MGDVDDMENVDILDEMNSSHVAEPESIPYVRTPVDQLPRLPPRPSAPRPSAAVPATQPTMDVPTEPSVSVVVETPSIKRRKGLRLGIAAALILGVVTAASFVWKLDDPAPGFQLGVAAEATQKVDSLRFEMDIAFGDVNTPLKGVMDVKARVMQMDLDAGKLRAAPSGTKISAFMDLRNLVMYIGGEALGVPMPAGKKWVRIDLARLAEKSGQDLGSLTQGATNDPLSVAALTAQASRTTDIGRETVLDGVRAEHFTFEVATTDALKAAGIPRDKVVGDSGVTLPDVVHYDVWVDADNYIRQMELDMKVGDQKLHFAVRYTEINPAVEIVLPSADESVNNFDLSGA